MSSPMPPPPPMPAPRSTGGSRWFACCLAGCLGGLLLVLATAAALYFMAVRPVMQVAQQVGETSRAREELLASLSSLDDSRPWPHGDEPAAVILVAADVENYLAVRRDLAAPLADFERSLTNLRRLVSAESLAGVRSIRGFFEFGRGFVDGSLGLMQAWNGVLADAEPALERSVLGPGGVSHLAAIVEWRFLGRPEAVHLGLPEWRRQEAVADRLIVDLLGPLADEDLARRLGIDRQAHADIVASVEESRERWRAAEAEARQARDLRPETLAVLEARRFELEALGADGLLLLGALADPRALPVDAVMEALPAQFRAGRGFGTP